MRARTATKSSWTTTARAIAASRPGSACGGILDAQRTRWIDHLVAARGHQDPGQGFEVVLRNVASGRDMGAFLAGLLIPLMLVVMVAVGCQTPAVDATAGERERGTWETLMTSAATRTDLVVGKYLAVATLGIQAGLLNLGAMLLTMRGLFGPALGSEGSQVEVQVPLRALPVLLAGTLAVALLVAAGSMLLAAFARSFKDGQAMTQPFLVVVVLGVTLVQQPDTQLTTTFALVPVAGVMLAMREALAGQLPVLPLVLCALSQAVAIAACLGLAALVLRAEDVVIGSYDGSLWTFLRARWRRPNRRDA
ncbi:MAG: ABC transporter permease [Pseudomonadota bacterium]